jgi:regulator of protease activity HflC (stomatin/prohibitin superfamily)
MAKIIVMEYERAVRFVDGRVADVLGPGRHRYRRRGTTLQRVDVRPRLVTVPGQEVLTSDGIAVRVTVVLRVTVTDAAAFVTASQDAYAEVYAAAQHALRQAVARLELDALVEGRTGLGSELLEPVRVAGERVGLGVDDLVVRDVMLPGELRRAYAEVLLARQRGRAELEKARAEAASLRSLANTARLLEEHPALLRLRALQAVGGGETKLVIHEGEVSGPAT